VVPRSAIATSYRREIDGLRAVAVLSVILHHAGVDWLPGGYIGVDVFFVISGFLIGGIVIAEREARQFTYRDFYIRRSRRILPALLAMIIVTLPFSWALMTPEQLRYYGGGALSTLLFLSNVWFYQRIDYFNPRAIEDPLIHTWSLGVEEQFYIILPVLILLCLKFGRQVTAMVLVLIAVASFSWSVASSSDQPMEAFYLLHTRMWELLVGVLLAMARHKLVVWPVFLRAGLASSGLALVLAALLFTPPMVPWPGLWTVLPVAGTAMVLGFGDAPSPARSLLSLQPVVGIGLVSYSAYLWHQPLLGFLALEGWHPHGALEVTLIIAATLTLAVLSWGLIEEPFRRERLPRAVSRVLLVVGTIAIAGFSVGGHVTEGYPARLPPEVLAITDIEALRPATYRQCLDVRRDEGSIRDLNESCHHGADVPPKIAIWGDSHAAVLAAPLGNAIASHGLSLIELTTSSCQPIPGLVNVSQRRSEQCAVQNARILGWLVDMPEIETVILYAYWDSYIINQDYDNGAGDLVRDRLYSVPFEVPVDLSEIDRLRAVSDRLVETMARLRAAGKRVVVITSLPAPGFDVPDALARRQWREGQRPETMTIPAKAYRNYSAVALKVLNAACIATGAECVDLSDQFCSAEVCVAVSDGNPLYVDANHLSLEGVGRLTKPLLELLMSGAPEDN
jgi:peptidoglycan/LPS O-acetylase OafA/YrhL